MKILTWGYVGRRTRRVVVAAGVLFGAVAGIAYATIPDSGGVIHGCYQKDVGTLRVIDPGAGQACLPSEIPISWSQTGPAGAQGPQGSPGVPGQNGAPGANGKDGVSPTVAQLAPGDTHCGGAGAAITDAAGNTAYVCNGTNGKDGQPFSGTFTSPNGQFAVNVTDNGITLTGPTGSINLDAGSLTLNTAGTTKINAGALALNAVSQIAINGSGSCAPAARQGDPLNVAGVDVGPGPITITSASIAQGSQSVCIGP